MSVASLDKEVRLMLTFLALSFVVTYAAKVLAALILRNWSN